MPSDWLLLSLLLNATAFIALWVARMARSELREDLRRRDKKIAALEADTLALMDERNRYKGAWEAIAPKAGEIHLTRIIRPPATLDEEINKLIGPVRKGDVR